MSLSLSHWYPGSGVVLDCIDSCSLHPNLFNILFSCRFDVWVIWGLGGVETIVEVLPGVGRTGGKRQSFQENRGTKGQIFRGTGKERQTDNIGEQGK